MAAPEDAVVWPRWLQQTRDRFLRQNVFYLLSALLMLLGCYLISLPYLTRPRPEIGELLLLLGVINVYEGLVILACAFIMRREPASREAALLLFVEMLFLFDMTFTANGCLTRHFRLGLAVAAASYVLALLKLYALEAGVRRPLFSGIKRFLIPALLLLYSLQGVLVLYPPDTPQLRALSAYTVWVALGALGLLLPPLERVAPERTEPWCATASFRRVVGGLGMGLLALQLVAQSWVHRSPVEYSSVLPLCCGLAAAASFFVAHAKARRWAAERALLVVALCAVGLLAGSGYEWTLGRGGDSVTLTPLRLDLFFAALAAGVMYRRERSQWHAHALCALLVAGVIGTDSEALAEFWRRPAFGQFAACVAIGIAWCAFRPSLRRAAAAFLANLWLGLRWLEAPAAPWEWLRWGLLGLLVLSWTFEARARPWWWGLHAAVFVCGAWSCQPQNAAALIYFYDVALLWCVWATDNRRVYGPVLLAYVTVAQYGLATQELPLVSVGKGWLVIALAFAAFGLAFSITRRKLASQTNPAREVRDGSAQS